MPSLGVQSAAALPPLKKAVAFVRLALDLPAEERAASEHQQQAAFIKFCDRHGFEPVSTFGCANGTGKAEAADVLAPAEYARMRHLISTDADVAAVAIHQLEALSAVPEDQALCLLELENLGAKVYLFTGQAVDPASVLAGTWPAPPKTPSDTSPLIKAAMRSKAMRGEGLGKPPYGYKIGPNRKLEIVAAEADLVRLIYSLYTQKDQGIRLIVRHLNQHGIVTRKGRNWSMVTIRDILRNRAYLGTYTRFGMRVPGSHPAIITPDMFRWTQERLLQRTPMRRAVQAKPFLLSGLAHCDTCGNRMMGVTRRQSWTRQKDGTSAEREYRYYQCQSRTNQGVCGYQTQNALELEAKVLAYLEEQRDRFAASVARRPSLAAEAALPKEQKRLQTALAKVEAQLRRSIKRVQSGKLSLLRFRPDSEKLLHSRREVLDRLDTLSEHERAGKTLPSPTQTAVAAIDELAAGWESMDFERKRKLVGSIIERIGIKDDALALTLNPELA